MFHVFSLMNWFNFSTQPSMVSGTCGVEAAVPEAPQAHVSRVGHYMGQHIRP